MGQCHPGNAPAQHPRGHGGQQTRTHRDAFGQVFEQAKNKRGHACKQDSAEDGAFFRCGRVVAGGGKADQNPHGDGDAADAGGGLGMKFLYAIGTVDGKTAVPRLGQHQENAGTQGGRSCHQGIVAKELKHGWIGQKKRNKKRADSPMDGVAAVQREAAHYNRSHCCTQRANTF